MRAFYVKPKRSLQTQIFEEKAIFPLKKSVSANFLSIFSKIKKSHRTNNSASRGFLTCCGKSKILSVTPKRSLETQTFEENVILPLKINMMANFFSNYRVRQASRNNLKGPGRSYDTFCASYKINSSGPKKLMGPKFSEKGSGHGEQNFLNYFFTIKISKTSRIFLKEFTCNFRNYGASYKILS